MNLPICNIWLHSAQHVNGGLVNLEENTIEDLPQTQELQDLAGLRVHGIDTTHQIRQKLAFQHSKRISKCYEDGFIPTDADHKQKLGLRAHIEPTLEPGLTLELHKLLLLHITKKKSIRTFLTE